MLLKENSFVKKKYFKLYIAALLGWIITVLGDFFDSFAAGSYLDVNAVSAIELVTPLQLLVSFMSIIVCFGTAIRHSQVIGEDNKEKAHKIAGMSLLVAVVTSIVLYASLMLLKYPILNSYDISSSVYAYADEYYTYNMTTALISPIYYCLYYLVLYDGDETNSFVSDTLMAIVTMAGPYLLVSKFGIKGIAITTPLSLAFATIPSFVHLISKRNSIRFKLCFMLDEIIEDIKCSSAVAIVTLYMSVVDIVFNGLIVSEYTDLYLPAYAVTNLVLNLANCLVVPMSAGGVFVSCNYGENNPFAIKRVFVHSLKHGVILSVFLSLILIVSSPYIPDLFGIVDLGVKEAAMFSGIVVPISFVGYMLCLNFMSYYSMTNNIMYGNLVSSLYMFIIPLVFVYPLGALVSFDVMNIGFALTPFVSIFVMFVIFKFSKKKNAAPLFLPETDEEEFHYDILLEANNSTVKSKITNDLSNKEIKESVVNEVGIVVEDTLRKIFENNPKKTVGEITILFNKEHLRLIIKDSGKIFDLISDNDEKTNYEKSNSVATSFNRNIYTWNLKK